MIRILKTFAISIVAAIVIASAGGIVLSQNITDTINLEKRRALERYAQITSEVDRADNGLSFAIRQNTDLINNYRGTVVGLRNDLTTIEGELIAQLNEVDTRNNVTSSELSLQYDIINDTVSTLNKDIADVLTMLMEVNADLMDLSAKQERMLLVQSGALANNTETITTIGTCPKNVINREEHLPILRRAIEDTPNQYRGTHDVSVTFDITEEGNTIFKNVESSTASNNLLSAVRQYVDALVFEKPDNSFANCEMIVKLNIS